MESPRSVSDIHVVETKGPWISKSSGQLDVLFALSQEAVKRFLDFNNAEFENIPIDIRGLRAYTVSDIPKGGVGGKEWHKARSEYITALSGAAVLECVDLNGDEKEFVLDGKTSIIIPPTILHTYQSLVDGTKLQVIVNTLYIPDEPATYDTFSVDTFS